MQDYELQHFLQDYLPTKRSFIDYSPYPRDSIERSIGQWLNNRGWNDDGRSVVSRGFDGTGGDIVQWGRPGGEAAIVYFGSEGGYGVLAPSFLEWVRTIARGATILEQEPPGILYVPETRPPHEEKALREFRRITEGQLGLDSDAPDLSELDAEFVAWVAARRQTFSVQDMLRYGLQGGASSGILRARVCAELGLRKANAKALLKRLNASDIERTAFEEALAKARAGLEA